MRAVSLILLLASLLSSAVASAQQPSRPQGGPGMGMGHGGPGMMGPGGMQGGPGMGPGSQQQAPGGMMGPYGYRGLDRDGNGMISREELRTHRQMLDRMAENWDEADRNGDGNLDASEFSAFQQPPPAR